MARFDQLGREPVRFKPVVRLKGHPDVLKVETNDEDDTLRVTLNDDVQDGSFIAELLVRNGFRVKLLREEEIDLEDVFMGITKGITN